MRHVTLKQFRVLAAVARTGSVTKAAQALHVSPPAITLQLQALQDHAGLPLVERSPSGVVLTLAGREVVEAAGRIEAVLSDCAATLAALSGAERGTVSVGVISTAKYFAPRALAAFARAHPGLELQLVVGNRAEIIEGLRSHALDLAVTGRPPDELGVEAAGIGDHPHVVVASHDHSLVPLHRIPPKALADEIFLVREPGSGTRGLMERFFADAGIAPRIGMQIGSNETIKQAVLAGLGIAFLSAHTIEMEIDTGRLAVLDVVGLPIVRTWYVVHLTERRLMPGTRALCEFLTSEGRRFLPDLGAVQR